MSKKTILAVDDVSSNLVTIKEILMNDDFDIRVAKTGMTALDILEKTEIDLVLLDIEMPGLSGFDVMEKLQLMPRGGNIPVIFVTSHLNSDFVTRATKAGAKNYVVKPITPDVLKDRIRRVFTEESDFKALWRSFEEDSKRLGL
ncbi:MAG: response regulator [Synergistaceae bacterium]|jgi:CheY-like chemotaxis protein|nr:response regulator [Synergistaceae bacterium]